MELLDDLGELAARAKELPNLDLRFRNKVVSVAAEGPGATLQVETPQAIMRATPGARVADIQVQVDALHQQAERMLQTLHTFSFSTGLPRR